MATYNETREVIEQNRLELRRISSADYPSMADEQEVQRIIAHTLNDLLEIANEAFNSRSRNDSGSIHGSGFPDARNR